MRLICLGLLASLLFSQCKQEGATISFEIEVESEAPLLMGIMMDEAFDIDTFYVDANNRIQIDLNESELKKVNFIYEKTKINPFINNGDKLHVLIKKGDAGLEVIYKGDNAAINNYKVEREQVVDYSLIREIYADDKATLPFSDVEAGIDAMHTQWLERLKSLKGADKKFVSDEESYLKYYFAYIKSVYPWYMSRQTGKALDADSDFNSFMAGLEEDTAHESVEMYYQVFDQKVRLRLNLEETNKNLGDSVYIVELNTIDHLIQSQKLKNRMLSNSISSYLSWGINGLLEETYARYLQLCSDESMKQRVQSLYENAIKLQPGQPAPDFDMYTQGGDKVMLSDLKGKYVYFDVWATWCGPCKAEIPYLAKVVEALKDKNNIEIISISVDSDHEAWVKMIEEDQPQWKQFIVKDAFNSSLTKQYNISGIPQFVLIDPDGNIIDVQAKRPSHPELLPLLKSY
ncbi:TlpA family protein disulfide reductase [Carboxylicivirga sediminis]|uniref:TlpA family protein disulfide reductase n=1 Tax=Carboxylicivirga sediminis TaxID=2006564 RepID=A0A941F661_9BACT|nr:TlpA disulfide reductase family protein [Carboxylicivirga sediminis]MBR8536689.1 TlpA family protein disulfide reductase [Carboxylicivirga sediminis]